MHFTPDPLGESGRRDRHLAGGDAAVIRGNRRVPIGPETGLPEAGQGPLCQDPVLKAAAGEDREVSERVRIPRRSTTR